MAIVNCPVVNMPTKPIHILWMRDISQLRAKVTPAPQSYIPDASCVKLLAAFTTYSMDIPICYLYIHTYTHPHRDPPPFHANGWHATSSGQAEKYPEHEFNHGTEGITHTGFPHWSCQLGCYMGKCHSPRVSVGVDYPIHLPVVGFWQVSQTGRHWRTTAATRPDRRVYTAICILGSVTNVFHALRVATWAIQQGYD